MLFFSFFWRGRKVSKVLGTQRPTIQAVMGSGLISRTNVYKS